MGSTDWQRFSCPAGGKDVPMSIGERLIAGCVAVMGLYGLLENEAFARSSVRTSSRYFGIDLRKGSRAYRFNWVFSRTMAIVVGTLMFVAGILGVAGFDWRDIYR
jgi:hypothetical protein